MQNDKQPAWYKEAIIYQVHIQSFFDSNDDGIGDFKGLTEKLDYIKSLGVTAVWLLPFYPSPLKDGGYDIANYNAINPIYGNLGDFKRFLKAAHDRNLRVITELVMNHTSNQHPWFQRARKAKEGSPKRDFYVWNPTPDKYNEARIIFQDFESSNWSWDNVAKAYYWHRFYNHQPDLNYDNPEVHQAIIEAMDFWFDLGIDGLRLDAIPYLFEREGTNCENLPETHAFLKKIRAHIDKKYTEKMLLAEANQWTEDAVAYFGDGDGDECHMAFHFPLMPRMFMSVKMEDRFPIIDILEQTPEIPKNCHWALFLRNHDELTLEMVTDEERDYMWKSFARDPQQRINLGIRRRLAPLLENDRTRIELMNMLLFSLPGSPVLYYGDELGMGDNFYLGDRDGVRTPMQWSPDKNAGFSRVNPQKLFLPIIIDPEYHYEAVNVENQDRNQSSLLWWMRRIIGLRKKYKAFSTGSLHFIDTDNSNILAYTRELDEEVMLVVVNLSRYPQIVQLDLSDYSGSIPRELFSQEDFPSLDSEDYQLSLGGHGYFWFHLKPQEDYVSPEEVEKLPEIKTTLRKWNSLSIEIQNFLTEEVIGEYVKKCRWYRGKTLKIRDINVADYFTIQSDDTNTHVLLLEFNYTKAPSFRYFLPVSVVKGDSMFELRNDYPRSAICDIELQNEKGIIYDSLYNTDFLENLFDHIYQRKKIKGRFGEISFHSTNLIKKLIPKSQLPVEAHFLDAEQSNSSVLFNDTFLLKFYRGIDEGVNPEIEILKYLTEKSRFSNVAPYAGEIEYRSAKTAPMSIGILTQFMENENDAFSYYLNRLDQFMGNVLSQRHETGGIPTIKPSIIDMKASDLPDELESYMGNFPLEMTRLLGKRTGEMHVALAKQTDKKEFKPEPFSLLYQKALYQSFRGLVKKSFQLLRSQIKKLPDHVRAEAEEVLASEDVLVKFLERIKTERVISLKTRIHGDYHLGQVLFTGKDFIIIDFEGEPARSLSERQLKYCPFRDVAGMIRSFHYAVYTVFDKYVQIRPEDKEYLEPWVEIWYKSNSWLFLDSYVKAVKDTGIGGENKEDLKTLLQLFLLQKAVYELSYELNNRPDWVIIPIRGINYLLKSFL